MELIDEGLAVAGLAIEADRGDFHGCEGVADCDELFLELGENQDAAAGGDGLLGDFEKSLQFRGTAGDWEGAELGQVLYAFGWMRELVLVLALAVRAGAGRLRLRVGRMCLPADLKDRGIWRRTKLASLRQR